MDRKVFLKHEERWIYRLLILVAGFYGGYAMLVRGGAFSNAQTGNVALMAIELGKGNFANALYYLIPISAYMLGAAVSELMPRSLKKYGAVRWSTLLVLFEMVLSVVMGFIPASAPHQICQIIINIICAMQFNTFREAEGDPMATTFCTNLIRSVGVHLACLLDKKKDAGEQLRKISVYATMVLFFVVGVAGATIACHFLNTYAIWLALLPLGVLFISLLRTDLKQKVNE